MTWSKVFASHSVMSLNPLSSDINELDTACMCEGHIHGALVQLLPSQTNNPAVGCTVLIPLGKMSPGHRYLLSCPGLCQGLTWPLLPALQLSHWTLLPVLKLQGSEQASLPNSSWPFDPPDQSLSPAPMGLPALPPPPGLLDPPSLD